MALSKATLIDLNSNELILDLDADTSITADTDDTIHIKIAGSDELTLTSTAIAPSTSDGQALGTSSLMFSDLFLASGSVLNFNNGDVTLTHASNLLTLDGGSLDLDGEALILDADGDTKIAESSDDVIHLTFAGSTSTPTEFGAGYMNLKNQGTRSYIRFYCESSNAHYTELRAAAHSDYSGNVQVTLPVTAGTLATLAGTETFTNKTLTTPVIAEIDSGSTITLDATTDIVLDADGGDIFFKDGGTTIATFTNSSTDLIIETATSDKDLIFKVNDGGSSTEVMRLDGDVSALLFPTNKEIRFTDANESIKGDGSNLILTSGGTSFTIPASDGSSGQVIQTNGSGVLSFVTTSANTPSSADGQALGSASLEWSDLFLADGGQILFGNDQDVTLTHNADKGLILKHTATADDKPVILTLQTGETDLAANDVIGKIEFQAPDEGTGTDAILVSGAIQAVAEGDHSSSSNATRLEFMTGASEAAATKMVIASDGDVGIGTTAPAGVLHMKDGHIIVGKGDASNNAEIGRIGFSTDSANSRFIGMESHRGSDAANADLRFHTYGGDSDNGERVRIHTNGVLSASDGVALGVGTNNTASNVLDDYEEGSFTPQYRGSAGSAGSLAYTDQSGRYTKIGRVVNVQIRVVLSNNGSFSSGGSIEIYGLPFSVTNVGAPPPASLEIRQVNLSNHTVIASFSDGNTYCKIKELQSGNNPAQVLHSATASNSVFVINGSYISE